MRKSILALALLPMCANAADGTAFGIDLYGRSYHHDLAPGERDKLNEANVGWGVHVAHTVGKHRFVAETGTLLNSYYDSAYWIGGQYTYRVFRHLEPGIMVRHWETTHDTYPDKLLSKYLMVSVPVTDQFRISAIVRPSGYIAFMSYDF